MSMENLGPYTNFHELNQDWFLQEFNKIIAQWKEMHKNFNTLQDAFNDLKNYVQDYFKNLDVQEEINNKIDDLISKGEFWENIPKILSVLQDSTAIKNENLNSDNTVYEKVNNDFTDTGLSAIFDIVDTSNNKNDGYTTFKLDNNKIADYRALIPKIPTAISSIPSGVPRGIWDVAYSYVGKNINYLHTHSSIFGTPLKNENGSWGMTCSQFACAVIFGLKYENSKFNTTYNKYIDGFYHDSYLLEKMANPDNEWWSHQLAPYAISKGFAFVPKSISDCMAGDILCYNLGSTTDENRFMRIEHTAVYSGERTDNVYSVFEVRDDEGARFGWYDNDYFNQCVLAVRFPMSMNNVIDVIASNSDSTINNSNDIARLYLNEKLTKGEIYTCVCKVKFDDPNFMYPALGDDTTRNKLYGYKNNFVTSPCDDIYIFSFKAISDYSNFIRLIGYQQTGGISTKSTFYWCFIAKGCVQNINRFIDKPFNYHLTYRTINLTDTSVPGGYKTLQGDFDDNFLSIRWFDVNGDNEITKISANNGKIYVGVKTPTLTNINVNISIITTDLEL